MKVLVFDLEGEGTGVDLAVRAKDAGHEVRYWLPTHAGKPIPYGDGMVEKVAEWKPSMDWAELIVLTGNSKYATELSGYFGAGYPILGSNQKSAALELDRELGQRVLRDAGVRTTPFEVATSVAEAVKIATKMKGGCAMKPWGGEGDKAMTCVSGSPEDATFTLRKWEAEGLFKGQLMLQKKVKGVEMGISGWFGPHGWSAALEESFEHKKFLNDDLGENTGEMGTVIRHVTKSRLFDEVLEPLTDYLLMCNYVGDASVNCIIDSSGQPYPLEFTMRLGWPDFCIRQAVIESDPVEWMLDLVQGRDSLEVSSRVAVGVLMTHGDFPRGGDPAGKWDGYPIHGVDESNYSNVHFQQVREGKYPTVGGTGRGFLTAGNYVLVASGTGRTVLAAANAAYGVVRGLEWPSNVMYRTDIGKRLEADLPALQAHGFAVGMSYG